MKRKELESEARLICLRNVSMEGEEGLCACVYVCGKKLVEKVCVSSWVKGKERHLRVSQGLFV